MDEMLVSIAPGEIRAVLLERGQLQRLIVDRGGPRIGDLFLGRVIKAVPAIEAAFVDIGLVDAGFLGLAEARPPGAEGGTIKKFVNEGDRVLAQIIRTPEGGKGAKLTLRPVLAGAHLVYDPHADGTSVAAGAALAAGVDAELERNLPRDQGNWTLLPAAAGASQETLIEEADQLCACWRELRARSRVAKPPVALAAGPDPVVAALSQAGSPLLARIVVDELRAAARLRSAFPEMADRIETASPSPALFSEHDVEEQIEALLAPKVRLPSGGILLIEETAAVVAIDVDVGGADEGGREATALAVNRQAADAIARHLCLRDLAGHVVIDFVPLRRRGNQRRLLEHLRGAFVRRGDRVDLAGFTRLGLVELTRPRRGSSISGTMLACCPGCGGCGAVFSPLSVALKALREVLSEDRAAPGCRWVVEAGPDVIAAFGDAAREARRETEARLGRPLQLLASERHAAGGYTLTVTTNGKGDDG